MGTANNGGSTGKGFTPGKSGNPSGRPKMPEELRIRIRDLVPVAISTLESIMTNAASKESDRIRAAEVIIDRAYGKAIQAVDASIKNEYPAVNTSTLSENEKEVLVKLAMASLTPNTDESEN